MIKKFFKWLWELIKSFNTPKGLISLTISFMIFCGWALVFIGLGIGFKNAKLIAIGSAVITFWSLPLTPMWPIIIAVAVFIRKFILREKEKEEMYYIFTQKFNYYEINGKKYVSTHFIEYHNENGVPYNFTKKNVAIDFVKKLYKSGFKGNLFVFKTKRVY